MHEKEIVVRYGCVEIRRYEENGWKMVSHREVFRNNKHYEKLLKILESMDMYKDETRYYIVKNK